MIKQFQGDNVPLFPSDCYQHCISHRVEKATCKELCIDIALPKKQCTYWQSEGQSEHSVATLKPRPTNQTPQIRTERSTTEVADEFDDVINATKSFNFTDSFNDSSSEQPLIDFLNEGSTTISVTLPEAPG